MKPVKKRTFFPALIFVIVAGAAFFSFFANSRALAQEVHKEKKSYDFPLQLFPFNVPFIWPNGRRGNTIVIIYLNLLTPKDVKEACLIMPRIRDTLLSLFLRRPLKVSAGKIDLDGVPERLQSLVNEKLGAKQVAGVKMTYGVGVRRMEGAKSCKEFLKEFRKNQEKKKK
jgi:hypothetical protein